VYTIVTICWPLLGATVNEVGEMVNLELDEVMLLTLSWLFPELVMVIGWLMLLPVNAGKVILDKLIFRVTALTCRTSFPPFLSDNTAIFNISGLVPGKRVTVIVVLWPGAKLAAAILALQLEVFG
jgi:hypothetical protein